VDLAPSNAAEYFGNEVKAVREALGMTQAEFSRALPYSQAQVSKIESGQVLASESFAAAVDSVAKTPGVYVRLRAQLVNLGHPDWFLPYVQLEGKATWVRLFHPQLVPGLAQTPEYARAVLRAGRPEKLEELVAARMNRQAILHREDKPARLWVVVGEAALRNRVGGSAVMREQLEHLKALADVPRHRVQIIPDSGWRSSSYSGNNGGECIQWAPEHARATGEFKVRDSKTPDGPHLTLSHTAFTGLVTLACSSPSEA